MHHPNHAMVNAADSLMNEYGDAMQDALYGTPAKKKKTFARANPAEGASPAVKIAGAVLFLGLGYWYVNR